MIFAKFKNLILSCRIASFYNSVKLILFISLFAQHALVHAISSSSTSIFVELNGLPKSSIEYGTPVRLYAFASQPCYSGGAAYCGIIGAAPQIVNELGASFLTRYASALTFIAGVNDGNQTLMPLGYTRVWAEYSGSRGGGSLVHVTPKTTYTHVSLRNAITTGEAFELQATTSGYLAKGAVSVEMSEPNGKTTVLYTHDFYEESMNLGYTLKLSLFQPGRYTFVARFKSSVATNTSSNSTYQTIDVLPAETSNKLSISSTSPIELGNYFMLTSDITSSDEFASGTVEFFDGESSLGVANVNNKQATLITYLTKNPGTHRFRAKYSGDVYNTGSTSSDVSADFTPARTFSLINFVESPTQWDSLAKFRVHVYGAQPEGKVAFYKGDLLLTRSSLVAGVATGEYSGLEIGEHEIHAVYEGDANNLRSMSGSFTQVVVKAHIKNTLHVLANTPYTKGKSLSMMAVLTASKATGSINFYDGTTLLGTSKISGNWATLNIPPLNKLGLHVLRAEFAGDDSIYPNTSDTVNINVEIAKTTSTLSSSEVNAQYGKPVTLSLKIDGAEPSGQVSFYDGTNLLGTSSINAGTASLSIASLAVGEHNLTASYVGDEFNLASTSNAVIQTITKADTVNTLSTSNQAPYSPNSSLSLIAELSGSGEGRTGTVSFYDADAFLGSASVANNKATLADVKLSKLGVHPIRASYSGDANFQLATSNDLSLNVEVVNSMSALTSSANPALTQNTVIFTVQIAGVAPTGKVEFYADGKLLGTSDVVNGSASFSTKFTQIGSKVITASYSGDAGNTASISEKLTQVVKFNPALLTPILQLLLQ